MKSSDMCFLFFFKFWEDWMGKFKVREVRVFIGEVFEYGIFLCIFIIDFNIFVLIVI